jgi:hypothetical protein
MNCDAALRVKHVLDAMDAATGYDTDDGNRVALVRRIYPVSWSGQVVEELEGIELLPEEPLDSMLEEQVELSPVVLP